MRITLEMSPVQAVIAMAEGNPGAISAMRALLSDDGEFGLIDLCHLDDMGIYGGQIWVCYKDICNYDITAFQAKIRDHSLKKELDAIPLNRKQ